MKGPGSDIRQVQERWIDAREAYDALENREWRKEGEILRDAAAQQKVRNRIPNNKNLELGDVSTLERPDSDVTEKEQIPESVMDFTHG